MWKYIILLFVVVYVLNRISSIIFRITRPHQQPNFRRPADGNIHVDGMTKKGKKGGIKGGDYVDYEEVK